jgi:hypothetical protein
MGIETLQRRLRGPDECRKRVIPDPLIAAGKVHVDERLQHAVLLAGNAPLSEGRVIIAAGKIEDQGMHQGIGEQVGHEPHEKRQERFFFLPGPLQGVAEKRPDQFVGVIDGAMEFSGKMAESFLEIRLQIIVGSIVDDGTDPEDIAVSLQGLLEESPSKFPRHLFGE